ncbi:MAG TPA: fimbrial protein [Afifellaceae bacterium]|nr:fimbrial protein [Afifellaceae bacterium]
MAVFQSDDHEAEAPLDPAAERVRRKLVRLLVVSFGIMVLGLGAVIAAIVYKINERNDDGGIRPDSAGSDMAAATSRLNAETAIAGAIDLPAGARIVTSSLDGDKALLTIVLPDGTMQLLVIDLASGKVFVRYDLRTP